MSVYTPSVVHDPTTSLNSLLFRPNPSPPSRYLINKVRKSLHSHSCSASLEKTPTCTKTISDPSYELTKTSHLAVFPQVFHSKLKTLLFGDPLLIAPLPLTFLVVSILNTIHLSRLTVCLPDSLDLDLGPAYRLCLIKRL